MKNSLVCLVLLGALLATLATLATAGQCKYNRRGAVKGPCDPSTNTRTITQTLKNPDPSCEPTKNVTRPCRPDREGPQRGSRPQGRGCQYRRGEWSECDTTTDTRTMTLTLKKGDPANCEATKTRTGKCKKEKCTFGPWSNFGECVNGVKTKTREVLSGGDQCEASKTKPCRN